MATSKIAVTEGSGKNLATNSFSEDAVTKEVSRVVVNNSSGTEIAVATTTKQDTGNTSLASIDGKITAVNTGAVVISSGTVTTVSTVTAVTAITNALPAGTNAIGKLAAQSATGTNVGDVNLIPATSGGLSVANFNTGDSFTALTNSAQVIKASAGQLYGYYIYNPNTAATYVIIYNVAAASVTVGTTNPLMVICIPAGSAANLSIPQGIAFSNAGWSIAAATTGGGNSAPATALEAMIFYN